jgi:hypothetical protein
MGKCCVGTLIEEEETILEEDEEAVSYMRIIWILLVAFSWFHFQGEMENTEEKREESKVEVSSERGDFGQRDCDIGAKRCEAKDDI